METEDAGLNLVDYIRHELDDHQVRIILRTGQPGQAPERDVIERYDINDYKEKTELTNRKLYSAVYTALRSYRDIVALHRTRKGLEKVIEATATILKKDSIHSFAQGVLEQLAALLYMEDEMLLAEYDGILAEKKNQATQVLAHANKGRFLNATDELEPRLKAQFNDLMERKEAKIDEDQSIHYVANHNDIETVLYIGGNRSISHVDRHIVELFCRNMAIALDNIRLNENLRQTQREIVYSLCGLAESRSRETGNHVRRVAHYSLLMAEELGLSAAECEQLFLAAPLHDIGKIGIPDTVLNKPGKLNAQEWEIMKTHTTIGEDSLGLSQQPVLQAGAIIASQHHENWDGSGYPRGLSGERIHIFGRIVALADVFDALVSKRCYKEPWKIEEIDAMMRELSGMKFDPQLVRIYQKRRDRFLQILERFQDPLV